MVQNIAYHLLSVFRVGSLAPFWGLGTTTSIGIGQWWHIGNIAAVVPVRCLFHHRCLYDGMYGNTDSAVEYIYTSVLWSYSSGLAFVVTVIGVFWCLRISRGFVFTRVVLSLSNPSAAGLLCFWRVLPLGWRFV